MTYVLKHTEIPAISPEFDEGAVREEGRKVYHGYSYLTHATGIAQQTPYKQDDFYFYLEECFKEICTILDLFLIVFLQYCEKVWDCFQAERGGAFNLYGEHSKEAGYLFAACVHAGEIAPQLERYRDFLARLVEIPKDLRFKQAFRQKWTVRGEELRDVE